MKTENSVPLLLQCGDTEKANNKFVSTLPVPRRARILAHGARVLPPVDGEILQRQLVQPGHVTRLPGGELQKPFLAARNLVDCYSKAASWASLVAQW